MQSISLPALADEHLAMARTLPSGRSSLTIHGGHRQRLRQTLIAVAAGYSLDEHNSPVEGTVHVLTGRVSMTVVDGTTWEGAAGDYLVLPRERHDLKAIEDSAVLLSVGLHYSGGSEPLDQVAARAAT